MNVIDAVLDNADPANDAEMTAGPVVVEDVSIAVYEPLFWSVTGPIVPRVVARATAPSLLPIAAPLASFSVTVICAVDFPSATIAASDEVTVDC